MSVYHFIFYFFLYAVNELLFCMILMHFCYVKHSEYVSEKQYSCHDLWLDSPT